MWWEFWTWWHGWAWWIGVYQWLEQNNLWKAAIAFGVTLALGIALTAAMRPWQAWKKHRATQEKIADRLDTSTPGGLADLVKALQDVLTSLDKGEMPDDNGSGAIRKRDHHGGHAESEPRPPGMHGVVPNVHHGGGSAGHR